MRRTIDSFFFKKNAAVPLSPVLEVEMTSEDPTTSASVATPASAPNPHVNLASSVDMISSESEADAENNQKYKKKKTYAFRKEWLGLFAWLRYDKDNKSMHCIYCRECSKSMPGSGSSDFAVSSTTFRIETLKKHNKSKKHILCRDRCVAGKAAPLPAAFQRQAVANKTSENSELMIKFNTAYNIAKEELPFTKFKSLITLMKKNGMDVNPTYANDTACAQFIGVIADTLKKQTSKQIAESVYMSFMIDGDTDISTKECEIVYCRILRNGRPVNILIGHTEVEHANAKGRPTFLSKQ